MDYYGMLVSTYMPAGGSPLLSAYRVYHTNTSTDTCLLARWLLGPLWSFNKKNV